MKISKINLIVIIFLFPIMLLAQKNDFTVSVSEPYAVVDAHKKYYVTNNNILMMFKIEKDILFIQKFDIESKKLISSIKKVLKGEIFEGILDIKDNHYFLTSLKNKKSKKYQLIAKLIDFDKGDLGKNKTIVSVIDKPKMCLDWYPLGGFPSTMKNNLLNRDNIIGKFFFYKSNDDSKIAIHYFTKDEKVVVVDSEFNKLWKKNIKLNKEKYQQNSNYYVSNKGDLYILSYVYKRALIKFRYILNKEFFMKLYKVSKDNEIVQKTLSEEKYEHIDAKITEDKNGNIILGGYYYIPSASKDKFDKDFGSFYIKFNEDLNPESEQYSIISNDILKKNISEPNPMKGLSAYYNTNGYIVRQIECNEEITIIGEYYSRDVVRTGKVIGDKTNKDILYTSLIFTYGNIIINNFQDNELEWTNIIPKVQLSDRPYKGRLSYKYISLKDKKHIIFFDNKKNINLLDNESPESMGIRGGDGIITDYIIDQDGNINKNVILTTSNLKTEKFEKPLTLKYFSTDRIIKTESGFAFEMYKKGKEDIFIYVDYQ